MKLAELLGSVRDSLTARTVFAEPYEKDGLTVIAAVSVAGGGGGGAGLDAAGKDSEGGGFGLTARPSGVFVIKDGEVRWRPAVDVNRLIATVGVVVVAGLLAGARVARARAIGPTG